MRILTGILVVAGLLLAGCGRGGEASSGTSKAEAAEKQEEAKPIAQQRGLQNFRSGNTRQLVIVKAPFEAVTEVMLKGNPTREVITSLKGKTVVLKARAYFVLQLKGHAWTAIDSLSKAAVDPDKLAPVLAGLLKTKAVSYSYSSFSGATHYALYDGPAEVEVLDALDADDAKLMLDNAGPDIDPARKRVLQEVHDGGGVRFRSTTRKLTADEKKDGDLFVDRALKAEDAFLPDLAGGMRGDAGTKFQMDDLPADEADIEGLAVVQGDNPAK